MGSDHHIAERSLGALLSLLRRTPGLLVSVLIFICLDFAILAINVTISRSIEQDAVAINLAGRQRMLSQRLTKALLQYPQTPDETTRIATVGEIRNAAKLFDQTLNAFIAGGETSGGDLSMVTLTALQDPEALNIASEIHHRWQPWHAATTRFLEQPDVEGHYQAALAQALASNLDVLAGMNALTSRVEFISRELSQRLRVLQTGAFVLAFINFIFIVRLLLQRYHDVSKWMEKYREQSLHDPLTGLANRRQMMRVLDSAISRRQDFVLAIIDLDGFKAINDQHGHPAGDEFLKALALRLANSTRGGDLIARTGGDEFVGIFNMSDEAAGEAPGETSGEASGDHTKAMEAIGHRLQACFAAPVIINGTHFPTRASIGLCHYPLQARDREELMSRADHAMYAVKQGGGGAWRVCEETAA